MTQNLGQDFDYGKYTHVVIAPFHRADFVPDVAIIYGNPAQISRLGAECHLTPQVSQ